eukprot:m.876159 g.876159  ORF g.876159 m.876159 type:complete len:775 (-) comp23579_c0_seq11:79-2403(-)
MAAASADSAVTAVHQPCQRCRSYPGQCDKRVEALAKAYGGKWIRETTHMYEGIAVNVIGKLQGPVQTWAKSMLDTAAESDVLMMAEDHIVVSAPDEHFPNAQSGATENGTARHIIAISKVATLNSLRDLRAKHAPMLRKMFQNALRSLQSRNSDAPVVGYVDYLPTFTPFHLHVEQVPLSTEHAKGTRFLLDDILENLELECGQEFYETACLSLGPGAVSTYAAACAATQTASAPEFDVLKSADVLYKKKPHRLELTKSELRLVPVASGGRAPRKRDERSINIDDIYGATCLNDMGHSGAPEEVVVGVAALRKPGGKDHRRRDAVHSIAFDSAATAVLWARVLTSVVASGAIAVGTDDSAVDDKDKPSRRHLLVLVNPFGGKKKAPTIFKAIVQPMFSRSHVSFKVVETTHANHAKEIAEAADLDEFDGFVTVSGDGLAIEIIHGLLGRTDWARARTMPIGLVPAGSGNGMAMSVGTPCPVSAAWSIIKGGTRPIDCMSLRQGDKLHWAVLTLTWGIISDIDIESERYRWMGPTRFTAAAIPRLLSLRRYPGRLSYLPAMRPHAPHSEQADFPLANADGSIRFCYTDAKTAADSDGWAKVDGPFVHLMAMKSEWQSLDFKGGPFTAPNDGFIDLEWIAGGPREVKTSTMLPILLDEGSAAFVKKDFVHYVKTRAFVLEPTGPKGILAYDGERMDYAPVIAECHPKMLSLMIPHTMCIPEWDLDELKEYSSERVATRQHLAGGGTATGSAVANNDSAPQPSTSSPPAGMKSVSLV